MESMSNGHNGRREERERRNTMPFKFVDDGYPEADDYSSNYVWLEIATKASGTEPEMKPCRRARSSALPGQWNRRKRWSWRRRNYASILAA